MFIVSVAQHIKFGDLSLQQGGFPFSSDNPDEDIVDVESGDDTRLPSGIELGDSPRLSRDEERALARDSTAGFAGTSDTEATSP